MTPVVLVLLLLTVLVGVPAAPAWSQEATRGARELYNAGQIDAAIEQAEAALEETRTADAVLVLARPRLDRYRRFEILSDLTAARRLSLISRLANETCSACCATS